jgi:hypothetical protein
MRLPCPELSSASRNCAESDEANVTVGGTPEDIVADLGAGPLLENNSETLALTAAESGGFVLGAKVSLSMLYDIILTLLEQQELSFYEEKVEQERNCSMELETFLQLHSPFPNRLR